MQRVTINETVVKNSFNKMRASKFHNEDHKLTENTCYIKVVDNDGVELLKLYLPINNQFTYAIDKSGLATKKAYFDKHYIYINHDYTVYFGGKLFKEFKVKNKLDKMTYNIINKIMTSHVSNEGFNFDTNRKLLSRYLNYFNQYTNRADYDEVSMYMGYLYYLLKEFFYAEITIEDRRSDSARKKFSGVYKTKQRVGDRYKSVLVITDGMYRVGEYMGMAILDNIYLSIKVKYNNEMQGIRYHDNYNLFMKAFKKENKGNIRIVLDLLNEFCYEELYREHSEFMNEVVTVNLEEEGN